MAEFTPGSQPLPFNGFFLTRAGANRLDGEAHGGIPQGGSSKGCTSDCAKLAASLSSHWSPWPLEGPPAPEAALLPPPMELAARPGLAIPSSGAPSGSRKESGRDAPGVARPGERERIPEPAASRPLLYCLQCAPPPPRPLPQGAPPSRSPLPLHPLLTPEEPRVLRRRPPPPPCPKERYVARARGSSGAATSTARLERGTRRVERARRSSPSRAAGESCAARCPRAPEAILEERRRRREEPCWQLFTPLSSAARAPSPTGSPLPSSGAGERAGDSNPKGREGGARLGGRGSALPPKNCRREGRGLGGAPPPAAHVRGAEAARCRPRVPRAPALDGCHSNGTGLRLRRGLFAQSAAVAPAWLVAVAPASFPAPLQLLPRFTANLRGPPCAPRASLGLDPH
ncbi:translation initiation factor IF-2-like [Phodopus roborovskii]|uniref:translation initiation factor IF-2-like n=1 Tax=Phodopus roborovskii TaxID=109678 RepID=UPI0021E515BF|nr:translation initiation factor IF-2-like [Phodopus roborovskii]